MNTENKNDDSINNLSQDQLTAWNDYEWKTTEKDWTPSGLASRIKMETHMFCHWAASHVFKFTALAFTYLLSLFILRYVISNYFPSLNDGFYLISGVFITAYFIIGVNKEKRESYRIDNKDIESVMKANLSMDVKHRRIKVLRLDKIEGNPFLFFSKKSYALGKISLGYVLTASILVMLLTTNVFALAEMAGKSLPFGMTSADGYTFFSLLTAMAIVVPLVIISFIVDVKLLSSEDYRKDYLEKVSGQLNYADRLARLCKKVSESVKRSGKEAVSITK